MKPRILYIDGFNLFLANYHANREVNENCEPVGGFIGFLKQMKNIVYKLSPQKVVVVFDGPDAGFRRRQMFKDYKGKRGGGCKVRDLVINLGDKEEKDFVTTNNEQAQFRTLFETLKHLPVSLVMAPYYEADDVIMHLVKKNTNYHSIIASNDKDYLQGVNEDVSVYQFSKSLVITHLNFEEFLGIKKENYLFSRTVVGDESDKLSGINGIAKKTLIKLFPQINEQVFENIESFWNAIEDLEGGGKKLQVLREGRKKSYEMYQLMRLDDSNLNLRAIEVVKSQLEEQETKPFSRIPLKAYFIRNHLNLHIPDFDAYISSFTFVKNNLHLCV